MLKFLDYTGLNIVEKKNEQEFRQSGFSDIGVEINGQLFDLDFRHCQIYQIYTYTLYVDSIHVYSH